MIQVFEKLNFLPKLHTTTTKKPFRTQQISIFENIIIIAICIICFEWMDIGLFANNTHTHKENTQHTTVMLNKNKKKQQQQQTIAAINC